MMGADPPASRTWTGIVAGLVVGLIAGGVSAEAYLGAFSSHPGGASSSAPKEIEVLPTVVVNGTPPASAWQGAACNVRDADGLTNFTTPNQPWACAMSLSCVWAACESGWSIYSIQASGNESNVLYVDDGFSASLPFNSSSVPFPPVQIYLVLFLGPPRADASTIGVTVTILDRV